MLVPKPVMPPHGQLSFPGSSSRDNNRLSPSVTICKDPPLYSGETMVQLACAAYRINGEYIRGDAEYYTQDEKETRTIKWANKRLIRNTLQGNPAVYSAIAKKIPTISSPPVLTLIDEDMEMATSLRKYYKRLTFDLLAGTTKFYVKMHLLLEQPEISHKDFGFVAYWPAAYVRDKAASAVRRALRMSRSEYIAPIGGMIRDKDCEIIEVKFSVRYDAWKMTALIDDNLVFWWKSIPGVVGPCVLIKAKIKTHLMHWEHNIKCTQLNYVKAAQ